MTYQIKGLEKNFPLAMGRKVYVPCAGLVSGPNSEIGKDCSYATVTSFRDVVHLSKGVRQLSMGRNRYGTNPNVKANWRLQY